MKENNQLEKESKPKKFVSLVIFIIIFAAIIFFGWTQYQRLYQERRIYIESGLASDKFPFRFYSERELAEMGRMAVESQELINTPTRVRPEQTYAIFRQALVDGDMDKAAECFIKEKKEEWRKSLYEIKEKGYLSEMLNDLPEKLEDTYIYTDDATGKDTKDRDLDHTAMSTYYYVLKSDPGPRKNAHAISFEKNWDGDWKI